METVNVQFGDGAESAIITYFCCAQDPKTYENLGTVETDDARWKVYYESLPPLTQQFIPAPD